MTRTIYMEVSCPECGHHDEMDGREWSPSLRCPKCGIGTLVRGATVKQRDITIVNAILKQPAKLAAELPKQLPEKPPEVPMAKRYIGSGRMAVEDYVKEGKGLEEIINLMKGKLQPTSVINYYGYAIKDIKTDKQAQAKPTPKPNQSGKTAATLPVKQYKDMRIINIDVFEEFIDKLREELKQIPETEATSGALIVVAQISGMLKVFKKDIYLK